MTSDSVVCFECGATTVVEVAAGTATHCRACGAALEPALAPPAPVVAPVGRVDRTRSARLHQVFALILYVFVLIIFTTVGAALLFAA